MAAEAATIALDAGFMGVNCADWLAGLAKASPAAKLAFHLDPLSAFAQAGSTPARSKRICARRRPAGARLGQAYPAATTFLASGRVVHEAGGSIAQELEHHGGQRPHLCKASTKAGVEIEAAFTGIVLGLSVDGDVLQSIAKLRAARNIGTGSPRPAARPARPDRGPRLAPDAHGHGPLDRSDPPHRRSFAAAAGGADTIVLPPYTDAIGPPDGRARRLSRNMQLILMQESHMGQVNDPAAGSWCMEQLTDEFAREGWGVFQAIKPRAASPRASAQAS